MYKKSRLLGDSINKQGENVMAILGKITEKTYNEIPALRNSELGKLSKSFECYKLGSERTDPMAFGTAFHMFILEEPTFWENYIVAPQYDGRTKEGKEIKRQLDEQAQAGREVLRSDDFDTIQKMKQSLLRHPMAKNILARSSNEGAYTATINGVDCKAKLDLENKGFIFDLKTTEDATPAGFAHSVRKYRYDRQAAFYSDIAVANNVECLGFIFVAIEKKAPYSVAVYQIEQASIDYGRASYLKLIDKLKHHQENPESFAGISGEITTIALPEYMIQRMANGQIE